jgi:hypothetical protein
VSDFLAAAYRPSNGRCPGLLAETAWLTRLARSLVGNDAADDIVQATDVPIRIVSHGRGCDA